MVGHEAVRLSLISSLWQRGIIVAAVVACTWSESRAEVIGPRPMAVSHSGHHGAAGGLRAKVAQRPSHPNAYQDGLVVHAGGAYAGQIDSLIGHGGHGRAECRHDGCGDHCVVSPQRFGFYGTRWRTWPGTRVVQTAGAEELTPVSPPAMELPGAGQESRDPDAPFDFGFEEPLDDPRSVTLPGLGPPPSPEPEPEKKPAREPEPERDGGPKAPAEPRRSAPEKPAETDPKTDPREGEAKEDEARDDNLFDEAARGLRLNERLAMVHARAKPSGVAPIRFPQPVTARPIGGPATARIDGYPPEDVHDVHDVHEDEHVERASVNRPDPQPRHNPLRR